MDSDTQSVEVQTPQVVNAQNYFKAMKQLLYNAVSDKRLRSSTLLIYRTLCDLANKNYWTYPFVVSREELKSYTCIKSNNTIDRAKQALKNMGYVHFEGKPTKYTVYFPPPYRPPA